MEFIFEFNSTAIYVWAGDWWQITYFYVLHVLIGAELGLNPAAGV